MSRSHHRDFPPELSEVADRLRSQRYEASALELDRSKTRILQRGGGRRVARGGLMRKRTLVTALILFSAVGTGTAGAFSLGGFFNFPAITIPTINIPVLNFPVFGGGGGGNPLPPPTSPPPSASCTQYGCPTTTTVSCPGVVILFLFGPPTCTATVTNTTGNTPPTGTVTFTAQNSTATCTLQPTGPRTSSCSATLTGLHPGIFVPVTAYYSGTGATLAPSSGSTTIVLIF